MIEETMQTAGNSEFRLMEKKIRKMIQLEKTDQTKKGSRKNKKQHEVPFDSSQIIDCREKNKRVKEVFKSLSITTPAATLENCQRCPDLKPYPNSSSSSNPNSSSKPNSISLSSSNPNDEGIHIYEIDGLPKGFYIITGTLSVSKQLEWAQVALEQYSQAEHTNVTNLAAEHNSKSTNKEIINNDIINDDNNDDDNDDNNDDNNSNNNDDNNDINNDNNIDNDDDNDNNNDKESNIKHYLQAERINVTNLAAELHTKATANDKINNDIIHNDFHGNDNDNDNSDDNNNNDDDKENDMIENSTSNIWVQSIKDNDNFQRFKALRWASLGYHYNWTKRMYEENVKSKFPSNLAKLCR
jgi:hypothetical protein